MPFPRKPNDDEKALLAETLFPDKEFDYIDFSEVWMLSPWAGSPDFNCFAWSIGANTTIRIPGNVNSATYQCERAKTMHGARNNYKEARLADSDAVILLWGNGNNDILHASRLVTKSFLQEYQGEFRLNLDFRSREAQGFPDTTWSSKLGDRFALIAHPKDWLQDGDFGRQQTAYEVK
jgi:hypothetical protein